MGMDLKVAFTNVTRPAWHQITGLLASRGFVVQTRMIDGELAFPDEQPPSDWKELRVGVPGGMVTLRQDKAEITFVIWGNADRPLLDSWHTLAWAFAEISGGRVKHDQGESTASDFAKLVALPK